jgi:hypothetical protein
MKIQFSWVELFGRLEPRASSDGARPLANLLMDDGGRRFLETLAWLDEGLRLAAQVKDGDADTALWGREAWAAKFTKRQARIYSTYDDSCFQEVDLDSFEKVLTAWRQFIASAPDATRSEEIDVPT